MSTFNEEEKKAKIVTALNLVLDKIDEVMTAIDARKLTRTTITCSQFISDIEELREISHDVSQHLEIVRVSTEISESTVDSSSCSADHFSTLTNHKATFNSHICAHSSSCSTSSTQGTRKSNINNFLIL